MDITEYKGTIGNNDMDLTRRNQQKDKENKSEYDKCKFMEGK